MVLVAEAVEFAEVESEVTQPFLSCLSPVHYYVTKETAQWLLLEEEEEEEEVVVVVVVVTVAAAVLE
jgi:hypothetical protein